MKPVGLNDPITGQRYHAPFCSSAPENQSRTAYNLVGFQTKLKYGEQSRIFRLIPALRNAEFMRMGSIHRNTFICSPKVLRPDLSLRGHSHVYFAGQITGVEGYLESAACGMLAAIFNQSKIKESSAPGSARQHCPRRALTGTSSPAILITTVHLIFIFGLFEPSFFENLGGLNRDESRKSMATQAIDVFSRWSKTNELTIH